MLRHSDEGRWYVIRVSRCYHRHVSYQEPQDRRKLADVSRMVFGQGHLLAVACAILRARGTPLTVSELANQLHVPSRSLQAPLRRLLGAGFVRQAPSSETDRSRPYVARTESAFWPLVAELSDEVSSPQERLPLES